MVNLRELMLRLRPAGAPGAAARSAVPADRRNEAEMELEPVFAALAPVLAEAQRITLDSAASAAREVEQAESRAASMRTQATADAIAVRAEIAARLRSAAAASATEVIQQAQSQAREVELSAHQHQPERVGRVLERVRHELDEFCDTTAAPS